MIAGFPLPCSCRPVSCRLMYQISGKLNLLSVNFVPWLMCHVSFGLNSFHDKGDDVVDLIASSRLVVDSLYVFVE
ncbi:hypothetical protein AXX17_AT1G44720 [Arabidopsis thaliana]|uniref:Uncharacterized protein n=1 Tax=Arabidopsis thaliana TaxID=3702 RepID=A0A178WNC5_ARATH|nr:hypothetical protein AXX17_AT1G44720 [Arabidopsis thaliana]